MDVPRQIEFLVQNQAAHDAKIAVLLQNQAALFELHKQNEETQAKTQIMLAEVVQSIDSLARIAHLHEHRLTSLEDRPQ